MMQGTLDLVSAPGLGSSFSFELTLQEAEPEVEAAQGFQGENVTVYVRSPVPELTSDCCQWLEKTVDKVINLDEQDEEPAKGSAVLVELLPEFLPVMDWQGPRVVAEHDASVQPQGGAQTWRVNLHSRAGIAHAVMAASGRDMQPVASLDQVELVGGYLGLKVLLAEDHPVNQLLLSEQLEQLGCTVTLVGNGEEALRYLDREQFDVLLTDVSMPLMDGYELARELRQRNSTLPIIAVTANAFREDGERCIAVGMNAWLTKPIVLKTLHGCLKRFVSEDQAGRSRLEHKANIDVVAEGPVPISGHVLELFLQTMDEDLEAIKEAIRCDEFVEVTRLLHRIRGALAVAKAASLIAACREVEAALSAKEPMVVVPQLNKLLDGIEAFVMNLRAA
jgi:two-component system capsular synthesis sensor histidine kinase RcsC